MLLRYFQKDFEIVPVGRLITGITFALTFHMRCISIVLLLLLLLLLFRFCEEYLRTSSVHDMFVRYDTEINHCNFLFAEF
jgi:uncharacterized membrane protein